MQRWPASSSRCACARYDDEITVWVRVGEVVSRWVVFQYRVEGPARTVLAEGETRHVVVRKITERPTVIPTELRNPLQRRPG